MELISSSYPMSTYTVTSLQSHKYGTGRMDAEIDTCLKKKAIANRLQNVLSPTDNEAEDRITVLAHRSFLKIDGTWLLFLAESVLFKKKNHEPVNSRARPCVYETLLPAVVDITESGDIYSRQATFSFWGRERNGYIIDMERLKMNNVWRVLSKV